VIAASPRQREKHLLVQVLRHHQGAPTELVFFLGRLGLEDPGSADDQVKVVRVVLDVNVSQANLKMV